MKKLIIVCEEKLRQYGDFLAQLVSLNDDKDGETIGVKDGSVAAQVWGEKDYMANSTQISSEQYMLFIGNSKLIKEKRSHMVQKYSEYGMKYGWLGKQGVLFVDEIVDVENYDSFFEYAEANQINVKKLLDVKADIMVVPEEPKGNKTDKGLKKMFNPMKSLPAAIVNAPIRGVNARNKMVNSKKIEEQEYSCLIFVFYLQGLSKFLRLSEE